MADDLSNLVVPIVSGAIALHIVDRAYPPFGRRKKRKRQRMPF